MLTAIAIPKHETQPLAISTADRTYSPYTRGMNARIQGNALSTCPFALRCNALEWESGWKEMDANLSAEGA